jgi:hypothetical protein
VTQLSVRIDAARRAMVHVLGLAAGDRVFVVTDESTRRVGDAFRAAALAHGCETIVHPLPERHRPLQEVPAELATLLGDASVVINAFEGRSDETPFRLAWLKRIEATGRTRCGHCPGITEAMLDSGPLAIDYAAMIRSGEGLIAALAGAEAVRITTAAGTEMTIGIAGRAWRHDCVATVATPCNLPCGEIYCAPEETRADGQLVVDGSMGVFGVAPAPLRIELREGRIIDLSCADARFLEEARRLTSLDAEAGVIGELGIGINPGARIVGRMLEDEKALRTAHVAFGNNEDFGGRNRSRTHLDFLFHRPTIEAVLPDSSRRLVMREGETLEPGSTAR